MKGGVWRGGHIGVPRVVKLREVSLKGCCVYARSDVLVPIDLNREQRFKSCRRGWLPRAMLRREGRNH